MAHLGRPPVVIFSPFVNVAHWYISASASSIQASLVGGMDYSGHFRIALFRSLFLIE